MKTYLPKEDNATRRWVLFDAKEQITGKLAVKIADCLRGKDRVDYTQHLSTGANVIVINAKEIKFTGSKETNKEYVKYTGYVGGRYTQTVAELKEKDARRIIHAAVKGMMPRNKLSHQLLSNLHVYNDSEHPHIAQKPITIK